MGIEIVVRVWPRSDVPEEQPGIEKESIPGRPKLNMANVQGRGPLVDNGAETHANLPAEFGDCRLTVLAHDFHRSPSDALPTFENHAVNRERSSAVTL